MAEEKKLIERIKELEGQLDKKNNEIKGYVDNVENLEEEIMKLHELLSEKPSKKRSKKIKKSKLELELEAKEREIRELKNKMGYLRKDKLEAEKKIENIKLSEKSTSVIRVEDLREKLPLNILVKELQDKLNKKDSLIRRLKSQKGVESDFDDNLEKKDEEIAALKSKISELEKTVEGSKSLSNKERDKAFAKTSNNVSKALLQELQDKLNKAKRENKDLKKKIDTYEEKGELDNQVKTLNKKISDLTEKLKTKEKEIKSLKEGSLLADTSAGSPALKQVVEELKNKLNKSKSQISTLQEQLKAIGEQKAVNEIGSSGDMASKLQIQREMARLLQTQLDEAQKALKTKDEEIITIKNEAIRIKSGYEDLENQLRLKDRKISELTNELDKLSVVTNNHAQASQIDNSQLLLRIDEMKSIIEDLTKQNIQQRLEIDQLRKARL